MQGSKDPGAPSILHEKAYRKVARSHLYFPIWLCWIERDGQAAAAQLFGLFAHTMKCSAAC